jgi:hypothetical protein
MESFSPRILLELQLLCRDLFIIIRPYMYEHIHLKTKKVEKAFLKTVTSSTFHRRLLSKTRTLQITLRPSSHTHQGLGKVLVLMTSLCALNVCYHHDDHGFIDRLDSLNDWFPSLLRTLHIRPVVEETYLSVSFNLSNKVN